MCLGEGNEKGGGEGGRRRGEVGGLNFLEAYSFFFDDDMHSLTRSLLLLSVLSACRYVSTQRSFKRGGVCAEISTDIQLNTHLRGHIS